MEEIQVKLEPEYLENEVIAGVSEVQVKMDMEEIEVKIEPSGFPNRPPGNCGKIGTSAESSAGFKILRSPKKEVEEVQDCFEVILDSESNCVEIKEEVEEKYTPPELDPVLFCKPVLCCKPAIEEASKALIFKCSTCDLKFSSENIQILHEKFTHPKISDDNNAKPLSPKKYLPFPNRSVPIGQFPCSECPQHFRNKYSHAKHQKRVHSKLLSADQDMIEIMPPSEVKEKAINCSKCSETFLNISDRLNHQKSHGNKSPCTLCPGIFASKYYLLIHRRMAHPGQCRICPQTFATLEERKEHEISHGYCQDWPCDLCPAILNSHQARREHRLKVHPEHKQFKCFKCELSFSTNHNRELHMKKHKRAENIIRFTIKCYKCDITFTTLFEKRKHEDEFHSKKPAKVVKCSKCPMEFPTNANLQKHSKAAHQNFKNQFNFECSLCKERFEDEGRLHLHKLNVHDIDDEETEDFNSEIPPAAPSKEFNCSKCDLTFTTSFRLQSHEYSAHPVKKEFKCSICDLNFSSENNLQLHEKFTHQKNPNNDRKKATKSGPPNVYIQIERKGQTEVVKVPDCSGILPDSKANCQEIKQEISSEHLRNDVTGDSLSECFENAPDSESNCVEIKQEIEEEYPVLICESLLNNEAPETLNFKCSICNLEFSSENLLELHEKYIHKKSIDNNKKNVTEAGGQFPCPLCPKSFKTKTLLNTHKNRFHGEWACDFCPIVLRTFETLSVHLRNIHPEQNQLKCSQCGLISSSNALKKKHMQMHRSQNAVRFVIECTKCNITFTTLLEKAKHEEELHSKKPVVPNKYNPVKRSFTKPLRLPAYLGNTGVVSCDVCNKPFSSINKLEDHKMRIHPGCQEAPEKLNEMNKNLTLSSGDGNLSTLPEDIIIKSEQVFVTPENVKTEFISGQSEPEDTILGF